GPDLVLFCSCASISALNYPRDVFGRRSDARVGGGSEICVRGPQRSAGNGRKDPAVDPHRAHLRTSPQERQTTSTAKQWSGNSTRWKTWGVAGEIYARGETSRWRRFGFQHVGCMSDPT